MATWSTGLSIMCSRCSRPCVARRGTQRGCRSCTSSGSSSSSSSSSSEGVTATQAQQQRHASGAHVLRQMWHAGVAAAGVYACVLGAVACCATQTLHNERTRAARSTTPSSSSSFAPVRKKRLFKPLGSCADAPPPCPGISLLSPEQDSMLRCLQLALLAAQHAVCLRDALQATGNELALAKTQLAQMPPPTHQQLALPFSLEKTTDEIFASIHRWAWVGGKQQEFKFKRTVHPIPPQFNIPVPQVLLERGAWEQVAAVTSLAFQPAPLHAGYICFRKADRKRRAFGSSAYDHTRFPVVFCMPPRQAPPPSAKPATAHWYMFCSIFNCLHAPEQPLQIILPTPWGVELCLKGNVTSLDESKQQDYQNATSVSLTQRWSPSTGHTLRSGLSISVEHPDLHAVTFLVTAKFAALNSLPILDEMVFIRTLDLQGKALPLNFAADGLEFIPKHQSTLHIFGTEDVCYTEDRPLFSGPLVLPEVAQMTPANALALVRALQPLVAARRQGHLGTALTCGLGRLLGAEGRLLIEEADSHEEGLECLFQSAISAARAHGLSSPTFASSLREYAMALYRHRAGVSCCVVSALLAHALAAAVSDRGRLCGNAECCCDGVTISERIESSIDEVSFEGQEGGGGSDNEGDEPRAVSRQAEAHAAPSEDSPPLCNTQKEAEAAYQKFEEIRARGGRPAHMHLLLRAAELGHPLAQHRLGTCLWNGTGVAEDKQGAMRMWGKAADRGVVFSQCNLALAYHNGAVVPKDNARAARLWRLAADAGDSEAQFNLAVLYHTGCGVPRNDTEALRLCKLAAKQEFPQAKYALAEMTAATAADARTALGQLQEAAANGVAQAQHKLGLKYYDGDGVEQNKSEAVRLFRLSAAQGDGACMFNLADMLFRGDGVDRDEAGAVALFKEAAGLGVAQAQFNAGIAHYHGLGGLPKSSAEAAKYWRMAAAQDPQLHEVALAQYNLAVLLVHGDGLPADNAEAARLLGLAARSLPQAQGMLGSFLYQCCTTRQQAIALWEKAADSGEPHSACILGLHYALGRDVGLDVGKATKLLRLAAAAGGVVAKVALAMLLEEDGQADAAKIRALYADVALLPGAGVLATFSKFRLGAMLDASDQAASRRHLAEAAAAGLLAAKEALAAPAGSKERERALRYKIPMASMVELAYRTHAVMVC
eukprot:TRINITY_DN1260_c0_g1_i1.p1 TRINITY_DN1260_c0_g1~~TRINITY_DN1260_c0_g1_i1.p1  ORF type:complete len:1169 (+),score=236.39 TRINITY_DN1260_c0_g1_i1:122-3628(+)